MSGKLQYTNANYYELCLLELTVVLVAVSQYILMNKIFLEGHSCDQQYTDADYYRIHYSVFCIDLLRQFRLILGKVSAALSL